MEIIYKAVDGKTFMNQQDCENHEVENCLPSGALYYYEEKVHKPTTFMEEEKMIEKSKYVYIDNSDFPRFSKLMYDNGHTFPVTSGLWRWDDDYSEWVDIEDDLFDQIMAITRASAQLNEISAIKRVFSLEKG